MNMGTDAFAAYKETNAATAIMDATPHQLTSLLLKAALDKLSVAMGAIERGDVTLRTEAIRKVAAIVAELQGSLNKDQGGELAERLDALYEFSTMQLIEANLSQDISKLEAVRNVLQEINDGWQQIKD